MAMKEKVAGISVAVNIILGVSKILVGIMSNSAAILAEGLHSVMDIFSSAISYAGIRASKKPADKDHPYGHYKYEVLSGLAITLFLLAAGMGIIYEAYKGFISPGIVEVGYLSVGIMLFSAAANEAMARIKIHYGKKENSLSLLSDGFHSRVDVYASVAVLFGLALTKFWIYADAALALIIGVYIIRQSFKLGREAVDSLLDVSAGEAAEIKINEIAKSQGIKIFSLKTQKKGSAITANLEIGLPSRLSVEEATKVSDKLRESLIESLNNLEYVSIQIRSHEVSSGFYKPEIGKGFGWQRKGKFREELEKARGLGPSGYCVCPKCGYNAKHKRGIPCASLKCPKCKVPLERK